MGVDAVAIAVVKNIPLKARRVRMNLVFIGDTLNIIGSWIDIYNIESVKVTITPEL